MGPVATRLRLPVQAQDAVLAVSVALFQLLGTYRATGNQPGTRPLGDPDGLGYLLLTAGGHQLRWGGDGSSSGAQLRVMEIPTTGQYR